MACLRGFEPPNFGSGYKGGQIPFYVVVKINITGSRFLAFATFMQLKSPVFSDLIPREIGGPKQGAASLNRKAHIIAKRLFMDEVQFSGEGPDRSLVLLVNRVFDIKITNHIFSKRS